MDCGENKQKKQRERNPKEKANLISTLLFFYIFKIVAKGARRDLNDNDIYEIMEKFESEKLGDDIEALWKKELEKPNPWLIRPIIKMFGLEYAILGIASVIFETSLVVMEPILMGKVISYFDPGTKLSKEDAILYALGLATFSLIYAFFDSNYFFMQQQVVMRIRIACCSLMYRKCLKLNLYSSPQYVCGKALTLMTKDVVQFDQALDYIHLYWSGTVQLITTVYVMYQAVGVSILFGVSVIFLKFPLDGKNPVNAKV